MENEQVNKIINRINRLLSSYKYFINIKKEIYNNKEVGKKIQKKCLGFGFSKKLHKFAENQNKNIIRIKRKEEKKEIETSKN